MNSVEQKRIFVIIPAYNEETHIKNTIAGAREYAENITVVDDGSTDKTYAKAKALTGNIKVLRHKINLGKGAALKTGCETALKLGADILVMMDADGQHDPDDIPRLVKELKEKKLDIVFGSRNLDKNAPLYRSLGNKLLTKMVILLSGMPVCDILSGFRAFKSDAYQKLKWQSSDYSVETEMIINAGKNKLKYEEIAIKTIYNDNYKGMNIASGLKIFFNILKWSL